jgi:hypothetical protein
VLGFAVRLRSVRVRPADYHFAHKTVIGRLIGRCPDMPAANAGLIALNIAATMFSQVQEWYGSQPLVSYDAISNHTQC